MNEYMEKNREIWDKRTIENMDSEDYDLTGFKEGKLSLKEIELKGLGPVSGRSLLHLQCNFGMDTLSWAKLGASVTGVDYSEKAIEKAVSLSAEMGIPGDFIRSDIYKLPDVLDKKFDIVFTSCGVLCWLPDIRKWAEIVSHFLKSGGIFFVVDIHPFSFVFENEKPGIEDLKVANSYFHKDEPELWEEEGSYEWRHSVSDIINSLVSAGMVIESFEEYPYCCYRMFPFMVKDEEGRWKLKDKNNSIPLLFSLRARKEQ